MATFTIAQQGDPLKAQVYLSSRGVPATVVNDPNGMLVTVADEDLAAAQRILASWSPMPAEIESAINVYKAAAAAGFPIPTGAQQAALNEATWVLLKALNSRFNDS